MEDGGSFDVHFCPHITSDGLAHYLEGLGQSRGVGGDIQTAFKACRSPKLTSRYLQNGSYPPALGTLCNQSLFLNVPKGFGEVTSNTADKELSHLVPLKLSASSRTRETKSRSPGTGQLFTT